MTMRGIRGLFSPQRITPPGDRDDHGSAELQGDDQNVEEEADYTPPLPVPPTRQVPRTVLEGDRYEITKFIQNAGATAAVDQQLGFLARAVRVDNYTTKWLYLPDLDIYVPPRTFGMISSMPVGTQRARVVQESPPTVAQGATTAGELARAVWTERLLGEHTGFVWA